MEKKYNHTEEWHTVDAGEALVPVIMDLLNPKSVVDVGCGIGTFTSVFKRNGAKVLGIDGPWCKKELLFKNIDESEFLEMELEKKITLNSRFDLVVCLEVAEHLTPARAESFIKDLTNLGDIILFSAAIPNQGGENHFNEQWLDYWEDIFNNQGYRIVDCLRPLFWENPEVFYWYKQNFVLAIKNGVTIEKVEKLPSNIIRRIVHPELLETITSYKDKNAVKRGMKYLYKAIMYRAGLLR
ncbi:methyltransferase domain-containing protein [Cytophagales bacterium LB-30]|uniref:Methyltransferase domain-containing protein n=1 Tax=Shiella aurantiaca TaxID=3058365 RepID=A0ABT8F8P2_9BACT|nr:methyltransferase domain-containing protein [Shiella aurantiaca]MDN4166619.1 methyltransferase domain-containing protein [Shiella aurantiaca]